jgi:hypothetical protein
MTRPIRVTAIQTDAMRLDQLQSHTIIAQAINVQRLRDIAVASHNPLDKRDWHAAEDVLHDMLEPLMGDERYRARTLFQGPYGDAYDAIDPYPAVPLDLYRAEGGDE